MADSKKRRKKRHSWRWLAPGVALAVVLTAAFAAALCLTVAQTVRDSDADPLCDYLLESQQEDHEYILQIQESDKATLRDWARETLAVVGALVDSYETPDELPGWEKMRALCNLYPLWLLGEHGEVRQGDALPQAMNAATLGAMAGVSGEWELDGALYLTRATPLGTLLLEVYQADDYIYEWYDLSQTETSSQGFTFIVDADGTVMYWPEDAHSGEALTALTDGAQALLQGKRGLYTLAGESYYCAAAPLGDAGVTQVAAIHSRVLWQSFLRRAQIPLLLFVAAAIAVLLYVGIMQRSAAAKDSANGAEGTPGLTFDRSQCPQALAVALAGVLLLSGATYLVFTLSGYAQQNVTAHAALDALAEQGGNYAEPAEEDYYSFEQTAFYIADTLNYALLYQPALREPERLAALMQELTIEPEIRPGGEEFYLTCSSITLYDAQGEFMSSNAGLSGAAMSDMRKPAAQEYTGGILVYIGVDDNYVYMMGDQSTGGTIVIEFSAPERYMNWCTINTYDDDVMRESELSRIVAATSIAGMGPEATVFCIQEVTEEDGSRKLSVQQRVAQGIGTVADTAALTDFDAAALRENYAGEQTINGVDYYINVMPYLFQNKTEGQHYMENNTRFWLVRAIPAGLVSQWRGWLMLRLILAGGALLILLALLCCVRIPRFAPPAQTNAFTARANRRTRTYNGHRINGPIMGWGTSSDWNHKTPEEQFLAAISNLGVLTLWAMAALTLANGAWHEVLSYILGGEWERSLNIFACTFVVLVLAACLSVSWLIRQVLQFITRNLGPRSETMGTLFNSVLQYAAYLFVMIYLLYYFGVSMSVLLASAGLLTLVLSPTLNALLGDISAGMTIVMEDEYRVGDIVNINGYYGVVLEISLRSTRVEDLFGNVKVFNNSKITEVENRTQEYTTGVLRINVPYEEPLERIQSILENELPKLPARVPALLEAPTYEGVKELGESGVLLEIHFLCREEDSAPTLRRLNHELKCVFDRRGITIPYTQVVVHQADAEHEPPAESE